MNEVSLPTLARRGNDGGSHAGGASAATAIDTEVLLKRHLRGESVVRSHAAA